MFETATRFSPRGWGPRKGMLGGSKLGGTVLAAVVLALLAGCTTVSSTTSPGLSRAQQQLNVDAFDMVWETVRDRHYDPKLGGLDWEAVREELRPRVAQARTMTDARALFEEALAHLAMSHFAIISGAVFSAVEDVPKENAGSTGLVVRVRDGQAMVTDVLPESPAAALEIHPGWVIRRIGSEDLAPVISAIETTYAGKAGEQMMLARAIVKRLRRPVGSNVEVEFAADADRPVTLSVPCEAPVGRTATFPGLPPMSVRLDARQVNETIAYVGFNMFLDPLYVMPRFEEAVRANLEAVGFIIDLRGNPGGLGAMATGLAGWFVDTPNELLGTMRTRTYELRFIISPRGTTYDGPLAILVDGCSASTAEILAGGLKDIGRARIFGSRTAGAALPSLVQALPNGDAFQFAVADYVSAGGRRLEGAGVIPDVEVIPTRDQLLAGEDPVLDAAVNWIRAQGQAGRGGVPRPAEARNDTPEARLFPEEAAK